MTATRFIPAAAVLAGLALAGGIAATIKPAPLVPAALTVRQVPVSRVVRACPPGSNQAGDRIAVYSASSLPSEHGAAVITSLPRTAAATQVTTPGALALVTAPGTTAPGTTVPGTTGHRQLVQQAWSVAADGSMAPGLAAELADPNGQARVSCAAPGSDLWFVGPGEQNGISQIRVHLMNLDVLTATVELSVITDAGSVQSAAYSGITVPPHQLVTQTLSAATANASVVAIEVRTTTGRVAAIVSEGARSGPATWLPSSTAPATSDVIPGVPPTGSTAGLLLVVPGNQNARVSLAAITSQGRYQPLGSQQIDLPGVSASFVQLPAFGGGAVGLELTSNVPVTASVLVPGTGAGTFTVPVQPVTEQAVIAGNVDGGGLTATLSLTAPGAQARVTVTAGTQTQTVTIPAGHTVNIPVGTRSRKPFAVTITPLPGSGPVYAARYETQGQNTTSIIPALSALSTITLPPARDTYAAINP